MVTGVNESNSFLIHVLRDCKSRFDGKRCNSNQKWNKDKCPCDWKKQLKQLV